MADITIAVPIYNREKYLEKCIDSILSQTYRNFELLLIDDGSTDRSLEICNRYRDLDSRIRVITKPNSGIADVRNVAVENTQTEFIAFVDSDDYIHPKMYELLMNKQKEENADIVMCDYQKVDTDGNKFSNPLIPDLKHEVLSREEAFAKLFSIDLGKMVICWNKVYRTRLFQGVKFPCGRVYEDESVAHKLIYNCNKMAVIDDKLYYYVNTDNSIMRRKHNSKRYQAIDALIDKYEFVRTTEFADKYSDKALITLLGIARKVYSQVEPTKENREIFKGYLKKLRKYKKQIILAKEYSVFKKLYMLVFIYFPQVSELIRV